MFNATLRSLRGWSSLFVTLAVATLAACKQDSATTGPAIPSGSACVPIGGRNATISLGNLQAATVDCSQGGMLFDLAGGGASYLLVPEFAISNVPMTPTAYALGSPNATPVAAAIGAKAELFAREGGAAFGQTAAPPIGAWARQRAFDARLRAADRAIARSARSRVTRASPLRASAAVAAARVPDVGSIRTFHVISTLSGGPSTVFKPVDARLAYVGTHILLYVDTLTPENGFATGDLSGIGNLFDQTLYPIVTNAFGEPSDIDQNGHLIMLMTPVVNALVTASECNTSGFIAGFFSGFDLASSDTNSNQGEVFYTIAPDPNGTTSCAHTVANIERTVPATFLHEVQHLINFSQHVIVHNGRDAEEGWLDEGLSIVAEELGSRYYEQKFPPPSGRTNPAQLFPDSSQGFISGLLTDSYSYLLEPDTATITLHSDADLGLAWCGSVWLLARWLGDQKGEQIYKRLDNTSLTGVANIEAAAGEAFPQLFGDLGVAFYADSIPGIARTAVPQRERFATRNLREMYAALFRATGPSADVPSAFPIVVRTIPANQAVSASMLPGTVSYYRIDTPTGSAPVRIQFATPTGTPLQAALRPQVAIFRLPPGV